MVWCQNPARSRSRFQDMCSMMLFSVFKSQGGSVFFLSPWLAAGSIPISHLIEVQHCAMNSPSNQRRQGWSREARGSDRIIGNQIWIFISMLVVNGVKLQLCHWLILHQYSKGPFCAWELLENWMLNRSISYCTESVERLQVPPIQIHKTLWCLLE